MSALWLQSLTPITITEIVQHNRYYRTWLQIDYFTAIDQKGDHDGAIEVVIQTDQKHKPNISDILGREAPQKEWVWSS